jgi:hypothetical protein
VLLAVCGAEASRWLDPVSREEALTGWVAGREPDWLPFLPWLLAAPLFWWGFSRRRASSSPSPAVLPLFRSGSPAAPDRHSHAGIAWLGAVLVFATAFLMSCWTGTRFEGMPPAYHDEYSYLFQARTYLAGRLWFPSFAPLPELFDQMHVLNEGRFASRYFPGVGLWMAPFLLWGDPWLGHQLAQALAAMLIFWTGRELASTTVGLLAGLLFALSPGLVLFSNLLLAHHPTMLGLTLFLWAFVRWMRSDESEPGEKRNRWLLLIAGCGLAFAMLCRPMTAAGFGLPFGIVFFWWWMTGGQRDTGDSGDGETQETKGIRSIAPSPLSPHPPVSFVPPSRLAAGCFRERTVAALVLSTPLLIGVILILICNRQITGDAFTTPYQLYTDIYTPRHVYGFNNVVRGERQLGPKVLENYDRWAENLTPALAVRNVGSRLLNSGRWTLGIVPLALAGLVFLLTPRLGDRRWWLVLLAILSLHLAHVPYWFEGIMGWHYVFETAPLWLLVFAEGTRRLFLTWRDRGQRGMIWWWSVLILLAVSVNLWTVPPVWPGRLDRAAAEVAYPRRQYAEFRERIEELRQGRSVIVFVLPDPTDRHIDYVTNPPDLSGPVLIARLRDRSQLSEAAKLFPERTILLYDAQTGRFESPPQSNRFNTESQRGEVATRIG